MNHKTEEWLQTKLRPLLRKDRLIILLLSGILLLVISLPTGKKKEEENAAYQDLLQEKEGRGGESLTLMQGDVERGDLWTREEKNGEELWTGEGEYRDALLSWEEEYVRGLERELEELLSSVEGAGEVRVMITLAESSEKVTVKEEKKTTKATGEYGLGGQNRSGEEEILEEKVILEETSKEKAPFVRKQIYPKLEGVVIAARGAGEGRVRSDLSEAVQALFGLEAHKVKVLKLGHISSRTGIE